VVVVAILALTLLLINVVLRVRLDEAVAQRSQAVTLAEELRTQNAELTARSEQLLSQLSTSNERLTEQVNRVDPARVPSPSAVTRQVKAQRSAERAARRATGPRQQRARIVALRAQLRNAQTCSAGSLRALAQIHSGADVESGAEQAANLLDRVMPACRAALR
jgi:hypothetical protein